MFYRMNPEALPLVRLADTVVIEPPYVHYKRKADEYIMYVVKKGAMYLKENNKSITLLPGDIYILDPEFTHEGTKASWCEYFYVHFKHSDFKRFEETEDAGFHQMLLDVRQNAMQSNIFAYDMCRKNLIYLPKSYHISNYGRLLNFNRLLGEAIECNVNQLENYKLLCACKITEAFVELGRSFVSAETIRTSQKLPRSYHTVQQLLQYLNQEFEQEITGSLLEEKFEGNFDYMNRMFKQLTGVTIFRYLTGVRLNHAKVLLSNSSLRMTEISDKIGFGDEYYFSRVFIKYTGVSPMAYRTKPAGDR